MSLFTWFNQNFLPVQEISHRETSHHENCHYKEETFFSEEGLVVQSIPPGGKGKIRLCGVYWNARSSVASQFPIPIDTWISIKERIGLTLFVEPQAIVSPSAAARPPIHLGAQKADSLATHSFDKDTAA